MAVALDIGNVCVSIHPERTRAGFGYPPDRPVPEEASKLISDYSAGRIGTEKWLRSMSVLTGVSESGVEKAWLAMLGPVIPGITETIRFLALEKKVNFVFFSDTNELHMTSLRRTLPFSHLASDSILSYETGFCKPSPGMYAAFEARHGKPELYFDDLEKNIAGARKRGWTSVRTVSPEDLRRAFGI